MRDELAEEVLGDLAEKHCLQARTKSRLLANLNYWYQVINYIRPFAIKRSRLMHPYLKIMYRHYFKIAGRNLLRNKGYSFINVSGLSVGMAAALLIGLWVYDELSFDKYHKNYDRIAQVMVKLPFTNAIHTSKGVARPLESALRNEYGDSFAYIVMSDWNNEHILSSGEVNIRQRGMHMEEDAGLMLGLRMKAGQIKGLENPNSVMLSASVADALFGSRDPIGETIALDQAHDLKVTGVYEDLPANSTFADLNFIAPWSAYISSDESVKGAESDWWNQSFQAFVQISPDGRMHEVSERIKDVQRVKAPQGTETVVPEYFLHPMRDWHLRSGWIDGVQTGGRIENVFLFEIIGGLVLLLACINFMNLSTARSERRALEVGVRKSMGSLRLELALQFFSESLLVVTLSFFISLGIVMLVLPEFNLLAEKEISFPWGASTFWIAALLFIIFTAVLAGSYPSFYLSSFDPISVLRGPFRAGSLSGSLRKLLVVTQFTISVMLIIGTTVVYRQIQYSKARPIGYESDGLIQIPAGQEGFLGKYETIRTELIRSGAVMDIASSLNPVTSVSYYSSNFDWEGKPDDFRDNFAIVSVSLDYGKSVGWEVLDGRDFSRDFASDSAAAILNESAVRYMGLTDPVGKSLNWDNARTYRIVGVVRDMIMQSPYQPVKQTIYMSGSSNEHNCYFLRLNPQKSAHECIATVERVLKKLLPDIPVTYRFVGDAYADKFRAEERIRSLAGIFTCLAIFISCLGLSGLASFVAEQRTKEIGIRKVLGASVPYLWGLLSMEFLLLVLISCFIAIPVSYYFLNKWLQAFDYRTALSWWIFVVTSMTALAITLLTVSYQAVKAAAANPIHSLRSE